MLMDRFLHLVDLLEAIQLQGTPLIAWSNNCAFEPYYWPHPLFKQPDPKQDRPEDGLAEDEASLDLSELFDEDED